MGAICRTPPSKLLHSGADLLLTSCFRGGLVGVLQGQGCLPGPRPRSDSDLGLAPAAKRLRPSEECDALVAKAEEYVGGDEVIKGDSQKADDAAVPDHLWLRAFVLGYGATGHSARHLRHWDGQRARWASLRTPLRHAVLALPGDQGIWGLALGQRSPASREAAGTVSVVIKRRRGAPGV